MASLPFFLQQDGATLSYVCAALRRVGFEDFLFSRPAHANAETWAAERHMSWGHLQILVRTLQCAGVIEFRHMPALSERGQHWRPMFQALATLGQTAIDHRAALKDFNPKFPPDAWLSALKTYDEARSQVTDPTDRAYLDGAWLLPLVFFGGPPALDWALSLSRHALQGEKEGLLRYGPFAGILFSYLPLYESLPHLLQREHAGIRAHHRGQDEQHVDRKTNVLATGQAHQRYFRDADALFADIFNHMPLESQPRFVCDMGCGDGSWLARIHQMIRSDTLRGRHLREHPVLLVGVDYNRSALETARTRLGEQQIDAALLWGDIGQPEVLAQDLAAQGLRMEDGLHIRSFIDHNRPYRAPERNVSSAPWHPRAHGVYLNGMGEPISAIDVTQSFVEHLERWRPHVTRHGLVILEAHSVAPEVAWLHRGETTALTFDTHHGLSQQYLLDYPLYVEAAQQAGFHITPSEGQRYPNAKPFVSISLHRLRPLH